MYCQKCGKQIDYDATICKECEQAERDFKAESENHQQFASAPSEENLPKAPNLDYSNNSRPAEEQPQGSRKEGLGGAITGVILGGVALFVGLMTFIFAAIAAVVGFPKIALLFFVILTIGFMIPSAIFGVMSIIRFKRAKTKPIATLICGIASLAENATALICVLYALFTIFLV